MNYATLQHVFSPQIIELIRQNHATYTPIAAPSISSNSLQHVFSPEIIEVIRQKHADYLKLSWKDRQAMGQLKGYPKDTQSTTFKAADKHNDDGWRCHKQGLFAEALEHYDRALPLCPEFAMVWNNKGLAHFRLGALEGAKGATAAMNQQFAGGMASSLEAIFLAPAFIAPYSNLGIWYYELLGDKTAALQWLHKALALDPNHQRALEAVKKIAES